MSDKTVLISKDRLRYLEYLEKNAATIVNNAVFEIIEREKHGTQNKLANACLNHSTSFQYVSTNMANTRSENVTPH